MAVAALSSVGQTLQYLKIGACQQKPNGVSCTQRMPSLSSSLLSRRVSLHSSALLCGQNFPPVNKRVASMSPVVSAVQVVAMAADKKEVKKKVPSAIKRAKQAERNRQYNKSRKSQVATRMKKVFLALDALQKSPSPSPEQLLPIEKLIAEAYAIIDKSVKVNTLHKNKGANRKSRLARAKQRVEIALGWYTPQNAEA